MLNLEHVASPPRKKSTNTSKVQIVDLEEDEEKTCSYEMGGGDGEKVQTTTT
jgi:hypothetical protein